MPITITVQDKKPDPLTITVGDQEKSGPPPQEKEGHPLKMNLNIRKAVDGSFMIFDHPEIDIVIVPSTNKVVSLPKKSYSEEIYAAQTEFFKHLLDAGIITPGSVQGGNVHGAMEGALMAPESPDLSVADLTVLSIGKFIEKVKPEYLFAKSYEEEIEDMYVEPSDDDTTPLGKIPQASRKGTIQPYDVRRYLTGFS
jgi:hypothetical protein